MADIDRYDKNVLVIFDCDGVLVDSEAISSRVELEALHQAGCLISMDEYLERALGRTDEDFIWGSIADEWGVELAPGFGDLVRSQVSRALEDELQPIEGAGEVLASLPCQSCVASAATSTRLEHTLEISGLAGLLEGKCFSGSMVRQSKPAPDLFLMAAGEMGYEPSSCLVVEDSVNGVKAAVRAGMKVLGFTGATHCGPGLGDVLTDLGCREIFSDLRNLPFLIDLHMGESRKV